MRTSLLITIPFVLLLNSDRVVVSTHMYGDLSGTRGVQSSGDSSLAREIRKWTRQMTRGYDDAGSHVNGDIFVAARSAQRNDLGHFDGAQAEALDIVQRPLSLVTTYTWTDTIKINYLGNEKEEAAAPLTACEYRLTMPGAIGSTQPAAQVTGHTAVWTLRGDQAEQTISASATAVRWDVVVILVYVLGYLAWRLTAFLAHRARLRPRKI